MQVLYGFLMVSNINCICPSRSVMLFFLSVTVCDAMFFCPSRSVMLIFCPSRSSMDFGINRFCPSRSVMPNFCVRHGLWCKYYTGFQWFLVLIAFVRHGLWCLVFVRHGLWCYFFLSVTVCDAYVFCPSRSVMPCFCKCPSRSVMPITRDFNGFWY